MASRDKTAYTTNLMHSFLPICGQFTRALLAHQIKHKTSQSDIFIPKLFSFILIELKAILMSTERKGMYVQRTNDLTFHRKGIEKDVKKTTNIFANIVKTVYNAQHVHVPIKMKNCLDFLYTHNYT
jgi:hypothetical protein